MRQIVSGDLVAFSITDGRIVNDRVEAAECVDLCGDAFRTGNRLQVTRDDGFGLRPCAFGVIGPGGVARLQDHLMTLIDEQLTCRQRPVDEPEIKILDMAFLFRADRLSVSTGARLMFRALAGE